MHAKTFLVSIALGVSALSLTATGASAEVFDAPTPTRQANEQGLQTAIFAGGCFWGVEAVFSHTRGVTSAVSGYHGGTADNAEYSRVSGGYTRHAEAVRVIYDPSAVRYDQLLEILFSVVADPTLLNRQGPDRGSHYRAALIPVNEEQRAVAQSYIRQMGRSRVWDDPIVVRVEDHRRFYEAEAYHQDFAHRNPNQAYIRRWDAPKIRALQSNFPQLYRARFRTG